MSIVPWFVMAYVLAFGLATPMVLELPMRLVSGRVEKRGIAKQVVSARLGVWTILVLRILGFACWFALCAVPIMFSKEMNVLYPVALWFGVPFFIGIGMAALFRLRRRQ